MNKKTIGIIAGFNQKAAVAIWKRDAKTEF